MKEIAYVSTYLGGTSGGSKSAVDVLVALLLSHNPVTVISTTGKRCRLPDQVEGRNLPSPTWITPPRPFPREFDRQTPRRVAGWFRNTLQDPFWARRLQRLGPPELTIVNSFNQPFLDKASQFNPSLKNKTAMIIRGSPKEETFQGAGLNIEWAVKSLEKYDYLIFVSSQGQQEWLSFPSLTDKQSFYIPNCCQENIVADLMTQKRAEIRQRLGLPLDRLIVVCVASVQHRKGQDLLLEYFPDFLAIAPDLMMYLVGQISLDWGQSLRHQIKEREFSDRLQMVGAKFNALDYVYAADLLILPSRAEAMPRAILEAMALKTPVIASDVDGIPELIDHEQSGFLFSHEQSRGLVEAFERIIANPELCTTFANAAHHKYWSNFSRAHQIRRYDEALKVMLE